MFPRGTAPRGRPASNRGWVLPVPRHPLGPGGNNRFNNAVPETLPPYEWRLTPPPSPVPLPPPPPVPSPPPPPPHTQTTANRRKRSSEEHSLDVVKRQRINISPRPQWSAPPIPLPPPPRRYDQEVAGTSRVAQASHDPVYHTPDVPYVPSSQPQPHTHPVPGSSSTLQSYAGDKLSGQMVELFEACQQQYSDLVRKENLRSQLQSDIQSIIPDARLYLTGSSMNGLGCRSSDADVCLVVDQRDGRREPIAVLSVVQRLLRSLPYVVRTQLIRAKVPILRFRDRGSDLEFDLNVNNKVGIRNTFLLRSYAYADLRIRPMILVVKKWARHNRINDASQGTLSSYTLVLLVLHYLQTLPKPVLPSLQRDYPECFNPCLEIDEVPERPKHIPSFISCNQSSLGDLLLGFLKYYATAFRWDQQVISVREARALPRTRSYEWRGKYMCVEEPFERNNVARAVHEKVKFDLIKAEFAQSYRILRERRDLNSILPVRATINEEASRT
ncbi:poly(A) RNA polymerase GLD2 [Genypterus blacodes]|uniref:poly(A) RNA polymerase GLD2 n=1 Tax=Genypterus blacodes TaxID=154954 RepID=UPI003F7737A3